MTCPSERNASEWPNPAATAVYLTAGGKTCTSRFPKASSPNATTRPSDRSRTECPDDGCGPGPAATAVYVTPGGSGGTSSWPEALDPKPMARPSERNASEWVPPAATAV